MRQANRIFFTSLVLICLACGTGTVYGVDENPYALPDETWISISGTAVEAGEKSFLLDYGKGMVVVEMDDWDWYKEGHNIVEGDKVTVYGRVDDDLFETTTIEADSVYVEGLGTYFYADSDDEEIAEPYNYWVSGGPIIPGQVYVRGKVTGVEERKFTIDTGPRKLTIDTDEMVYNPIDKKGYQWVEKGDHVLVGGQLEKDFWGNREVAANTVVEIVGEKRQ
ncbi:MAG: NirD/YgiW/YdeI family stress tolerance protein [Desulfobacterales bacterium]